MRNHRQIFLFLGIGIILFGLCICLFPQAMWVVLSIIVGILLLGMGIIMITLAFTGGPTAYRSIFIMMGILNAVLGFLMLLSSTFFQSMYTIIIGIRTLLRGILLVVNGMRDRQWISYWRAELGMGALLIVMSFLMFFSPSERAIIIAILFGISVIVEGVSLCLFSFKMKKVEDQQNGKSPSQLDISPLGGGIW